MKESRIHRRIFIYILVAVLFISMIACAPINKRTKVKRTPKEYVNNFYGEKIHGKGKEYKRKNRKTWVVYSDKADNPVYLNRGGKIETGKVGFMEPFIVIKHKGEYVRLMKYDAKVANERKIKQPKSAVYVGWMPKSELLLYQNSYTDLYSGLKNKYAVIFKDAEAALSPERFLSKTDSAITYAEPNLTTPKRKIPLYEIVYRLKKSEDDKKSLISKSTVLTSDSLSEEVLGWIDNSLLVNIGQQLHVDLKPESILTGADGDTLSSYIYGADESYYRMKSMHQVLMYEPVYEIWKDTLAFNMNTCVLRPLVDKLDNYVYNTKGNKIFYHDGVRITDNLKKINVVFVLENGISNPKTLEVIANAIQTSETIFNDTQKEFSYKFGIVLPFGDNSSLGLVSRYNTIVSFLSQNLENVPSMYVSAPSEWAGVQKAMTMLRGHENETNLIVIAGENATGGEKADLSLTNQLAMNNCRILGFQLFSDKTNAANNFVLQIQDMISSYAKKYINQKQDIIVYTDRVRNDNHFKTVARNAYLLNFPDSSITQGGIIFPEKAEMPDMEKFKMYIDTIVNEIRHDNAILMNDLYHVFHNIDNIGNRFDPVFASEFGLKTDMIPSYELTNKFSKNFPIWYSPIVSATQDKKIDDDNFYLLVSEEELINLQKFISGLSKYETDYIEQKIGSDKTQIFDYRNEFEEEQNSDYYENGEYVSTRKTRKKLRRYLLNAMNDNKLYKREHSLLKNYSLADALHNITSCPWKDKDGLRFNSIPVGKLTKKHFVTDKELYEIMKYLKDTNEVFNQNIYNFPKFTSNGKNYYWVNQKYLP